MLQTMESDVIVWKFHRHNKKMKIPKDVFDNLTFNAIPFHKKAQKLNLEF